MEEKEISKERMLYTEGVNDKFVTISLLEQFGHTDEVYLEHLNNDEKALKAFALKITNPNETQCVGLIIDADDDIDNRIDKIMLELKNTCGVELTSKQIKNPQGCIFNVEGLKAGIWIMPNNTTNGRIEDFLFEKIDSSDALFNQVEPHLIDLEKLPEASNRFNKKMYKSVHRDKAKLHTYMAWSNPPDLSMGMAVKKGFFPLISRTETLFMIWIEKLLFNK